jgi:hypothetical protein
MQTKSSSEVIAKTQEKILSRTIKEITPFGVRLELNLEGPTTGDLYTAHHMETVSIFQKTDGSFDSEARAIESTKDGDVFVISYRGAGKQTGVSTLRAEGVGIIMTHSKRFSYLNNAQVRVEANADLATGELQLNSYKM